MCGYCKRTSVVAKPPDWMFSHNRRFYHAATTELTTETVFLPERRVHCLLRRKADPTRAGPGRGGRTLPPDNRRIEPATHVAGSGGGDDGGAFRGMVRGEPTVATAPQICYRCKNLALTVRKYIHP